LPAARIEAQDDAGAPLGVQAVSRRERAVKRKATYLPKPRGSSGASNNPIGGFRLGAPSNLPADRVVA
jgi:hypothetical protein